MSTSARVDKSPSPDLLSSADVSQGSPVVIPQTDIHSEGTLRQLRNKYACRKNKKIGKIAGTGQPSNIGQVQREACSIGIQCDLLVAAPLQKLTSSESLSVEESLSTDTEEADLDTSFQLTQEDTTTE